MKYKLFLPILSLLFLLTGCDNGPKSAYGFTLPDGNAEIGQRHFVEFGCVYCHSIAGKEDLITPPDTIEPILNVELGGLYAKVRKIHNALGRATNENLDSGSAAKLQVYLRCATTLDRGIEELIRFGQILQRAYATARGKDATSRNIQSLLSQLQKVEASMDAYDKCLK